MIMKTEKEILIDTINEFLEEATAEELYQIYINVVNEVKK